MSVSRAVKKANVKQQGQVISKIWVSSILAFFWPDIWLGPLQYYFVTIRAFPCRFCTKVDFSENIILFLRICSNKHHLSHMYLAIMNEFCLHLCRIRPHFVPELCPFLRPKKRWSIENCREAACMAISPFFDKSMYSKKSK